MTLERHLALWMLVASAGLSVRAQETAPREAADYPSFSRFISDRNIFDPARPGPAKRTETPPAPKPLPTVTPSFSLVGTMDYGKGAFAFFDGTSPGYRTTLRADGEIAGYKVAEIKPAGVTLVSTHGNRLEMKVGMQMRQEADHQWRLSTELEPVVATASSGTATVARPSSAGSTKSEAGGAAAGASNDPGETLKKLMQLREKEMK